MFPSHDQLSEPLAGITGQRFRKILEKTNITSIHLTYLNKCHGKALKKVKQICYNEYLDKELQYYNAKKILLCGTTVAKFFGMKGTITENLHKTVKMPYNKEGIVTYSISQIVNGTKKEKDFLEIFSG